MKPSLLAQTRYLDPRPHLTLLFWLAAFGLSQATDISWTNAASGNWATAANWSPNQVPGAADTAWITNNGNYTVTLNASVTLAGLNLGGTSGTQTLSHAANTLTLNGAGSSTASSLYSFAGGTLVGSGTLTLAGRFNWTGGYLGTVGSTLVVAVNGGLTISNSAARYIYGGTLINNGVGTWSAGNIGLLNTAVFSNAPGATLDLTADGTAFSLYSGTPLFVNAGTLRKTGGTGTTTISAPYGNNGSIQINSGALSLTGGGTSSGQFETLSGTTLVFGGGTHTLQSASSVTGPGNVLVSAGTANVRGAFVVAAVTNSSTLDFSSAETSYLTNLTLTAGYLTGSNTVVVPGALIWTGGHLGTVGSTLLLAANGSLTISNSAARYIYGGTLINNGSGSWSAGNVGLVNAAMFSNAPSATLDLTADGTAFSVFSGSPVLVNAGTLRKTSGTGTTTISAPYGNNGFIQINSGALSLTGGGTSSGQFDTLSGTTLVFGGGTHTLQAASSVTGPGNVLVSAGTVNVRGAFAVAAVTNSSTLDFSSAEISYLTNLTMTTGTLMGSNTVVVPGALIWAGGHLGTAGATLVVAANGSLTISNSAIRYIYGGTLINNGSGSWSAGNVGLVNAAMFSNAPSATLDLTADGTAFSVFSGNPVLVNAGALRKTGGTGTTTISAPCGNSGSIQVNTGTLSFGNRFTQSGGQTLLNGGNLAFAQTAQFRSGSLSGSGTITGSVSNSATISPGASPGVLTITGSYTEAAGAHLQIELGGPGPGTGYDQLSVGGAAKLAGTLDVSYWNGFTPASGNVFTALVCTARSGAFSALQAPTNTLGTIYTAKTVLLETGNASPSVHLAIDPLPLACHTVTLQASATDPDGSVTNLTLLLETNVLGSLAAGTAQLQVSYDFPGDVTFTVLATDNNGAMGATNVTVNFGTLPVGMLDPIGFQTNRAFKLCLAGVAGNTNRLEARDNLTSTNWSDLGAMENTNGIWRFSDKTATNSAHRYYRARQLP